MYSRIVKSMLLTSLAILTVSPAFAQIRADIGPLHIRIATDAPPRARYERRSPRPDRDSVWINGYWDRRDDRWDWVDGRWDRPSDGRAHWVTPTYAREGDAWRYEPGRWSNQELVEGEEYQRWRHEHDRDHDRDRDRQ